MGGDLIYALSGHTSFVYSVSVLPNGDLVSAGEDRSVRIWRGMIRFIWFQRLSTLTPMIILDGECAQVIIHPAISVWSVSTMPNSDIVSGCSDGVIRVFSNLEDRWANEVDQKAFEDQVSKQALPSHQVGDVQKADLPGLEVLVSPGNLPNNSSFQCTEQKSGKKAGEVKMVRIGDAVEAHQVSYIYLINFDKPHLTAESGILSLPAGKRLVKLSMPLVPAVNNSMMARNMTTYSM